MGDPAGTAASHVRFVEVILARQITADGSGLSAWGITQVGIDVLAALRQGSGEHVGEGGCQPVQVKAAASSGQKASRSCRSCSSNGFPIARVFAQRSTPRLMSSSFCGPARSMSGISRR